MAIYHFSMKTISRSAGRTATAAAAYRAGVAITDMKTGEVHNYVYKRYCPTCQRSEMGFRPRKIMECRRRIREEKEQHRSP